MSDQVHHFACKTTWTGGTTASYDTYSREMRIDMEGKPSLTMSAAPAFRGDASLHNPEDLLVAALSTCHALTYLAVCARAGIDVVAYEDDATGKMERKDGAIRFTEVVLRPRVTLSRGDEALVAKAKELHEKAHRGCFIANSVSFPVTNEPVVVVRG
jgi:peroxiredoxin-like protein